MVSIVFLATLVCKFYIIKLVVVLAFFPFKNPLTGMIIKSATVLIFTWLCTPSKGICLEKILDH